MPARRNLRVQARVADSAAVFFALGDETRLRLVSRLCEAGPASIARLAESFDITRQAVTKHLRVLEGAGVVQRTQSGRESSWRLERQRLAEARRHLELISAQWDAALAGLKRFVEN